MQHFVFLLFKILMERAYCWKNINQMHLNKFNLFENSPCILAFIDKFHQNTSSTHLAYSHLWRQYGSHKSMPDNFLHLCESPPLVQIADRFERQNTLLDSQRQLAVWTCSEIIRLIWPDVWCNHVISYWNGTHRFNDIRWSYLSLLSHTIWWFVTLTVVRTVVLNQGSIKPQGFGELLSGVRQ